jgi:hypothetical protein
VLNDVGLVCVCGRGFVGLSSLVLHYQRFLYCKDNGNIHHISRRTKS